MSFLEEYGFDANDISEFENNTPKNIKEVILKHIELVKSNIKFIKDLGVITYKEIFINYPDMFFMDASNFEEIFNRYEKDELLEKLNNNFKLVKFL